MKNIVFKILVFIALTGFAGCYYDVEEELYPDTGCNLDNVTFSAVILPIIKTNCYKCHDAANNFGGITLEGYNNLKIVIDNGKLLGAIRHKSGFAPMPQSAPQLLECNIQKIEKWANDGAPEN